MTTITKQRVLVETQVVVEPSWVSFGFYKFSAEEKHRALTEYAKKLMAFIRTHNEDETNVSRIFAEPTYEMQCSGCHRDWEEMVDEVTGKTCCAACGIEMEVAT